MRDIAQREDIRDLILDGVDVLLAEHGYQDMTMTDLAREVGIGKGTIYLHFRSKEEVTLSHIDRIVDRMLQRLRELATSKDSADQRLRKMLHTRVLTRFDAVQHYTQSLNDLLAALRHELLIHREKHFDQEAEVFAGVLKEGQTSGIFQFDDLKATSHALLDATNSLLPYSLSAKELGKRARIEKQVDQIASLLLNGLIRIRRFSK
jgi:AcrR family transcriptional regulator